MTGLWRSTSRVLGASRDGFIDSEKIVEVKCPYKYRDLDSLTHLKQRDNYIIYYDEAQNIVGNENHDYYHQIQGQHCI